MRFATIRTPDGLRAVQVAGDEVVLRDESDAVAAAISQTDHNQYGERLPLDSVDLAPPSPRPNKVICVGLNYETHILEMGRSLPEHPTLFAKFARALIGPYDPILLPEDSSEVDWEAELAVVIGREARRVGSDDALDCVAGYTVLNDVTMRDWQYRTKQWLAGKTFEGSTPVGPVLVTPDEIDHARDLEITCVVDDEVMQRSRTSDLVFNPAEIVSYVSRIITLDPGDIIATGTPGGVGAKREPPVFLRPGAVVRTKIEGIGELVNECRSGSES